MSRKTLRLASSSGEKWFHSINFGDGVISKGRFPEDRPQNYTLFGVFAILEKLDLADKICLDVGTMDGIVAFALKRLGAKRVIATDITPRDTFIQGRDRLKLDVEYCHPVSLEDLPSLFGDELLDLIVFAGVLYHLFEPLKALVVCRERLKTGGLLLLETQCLYDEPQALISFSPSDTKRGSVHANTLFRPSYKALIGMMEVAGFDVISTIAVGGRLTVLARAAKPSEITGSTPLIQNIYRTYSRLNNYRKQVDYKKLDKRQTTSDIKYTGPHKADYFIYTSRFKTAIELQPNWVGSMRQRAAVLARDLEHKIKTCLARRKWLANWPG